MIVTDEQYTRRDVSGSQESQFSTREVRFPKAKQASGRSECCQPKVIARPLASYQRNPGRES